MRGHLLILLGFFLNKISGSSLFSNTLTDVENKVSKSEMIVKLFLAQF